MASRGVVHRRVGSHSAECSKVDSPGLDSPGHRSASEPTLGERLRARRIALGISLRQVSEASGLARSFLSQVERDVSSPSVSSVTRIAAALDTTLSALFAGGGEGRCLVRADERVAMTYGHGRFVDEVLTPTPSHHLLVLLSTIEPGTVSGPTPYAHDADEECIFILEGRLEVTVDAERYELGPGDALTLSSRHPHAWRSVGDVPVRAIWAITPPGY